jgi:hypothetical protein
VKLRVAVLAVLAAAAVDGAEANAARTALRFAPRV